MSAREAGGLVWQDAEIDLAAWQGIRALRFVEPPPAPPAYVAELRAVLAKPAAGLSPASVRLEGPEGQEIGGEVQTIANGNAEIAIRFAALGPRGRCRVRLVDGGGDPLHPFFAEACFDFFIDCPADDCRADAEAAASAPAKAPAADLLAKDYRGFLAVAQEWIRAGDSQWGDLSAASTEGMLVELLAHHAEMLSLYQDRVAQEGFVDTARSRISIARHARFVGLGLDNGGSAVTVVAVDVGAGLAGFIPAGSHVQRRSPTGEVMATFQTLDTVRADSRWNAGLAAQSHAGVLRPAAWPDAPDAVIPVGARSLYLLDWDLGLLPGQRIFFAQGGDSHIAKLTEAKEITEPGWTDLPTNAAATAQRRVTRISWDAPLETDFSPWSAAARFLIGANLADAIHGEPRKASNIKNSNDIPLSSARGDAVFARDATGRQLLRALRTPEPGVLMCRNGSIPDITFKTGAGTWHWQPDLWSSSAFDRHFSTELEEDGSVWLVFGDGERGAAIPAADGPSLPQSPKSDDLQSISLAYRRGEPESGNLGAYGLTHVVDAPDNTASPRAVADLSVRAATNIVPARGGRAAVDIDTARQLIPESIRHPARRRCVTAEDYAAAALDVSGVAHAVARPLGGVFNSIVVLCAPAAGDDLDPRLAAEVHARLDALRMAGREHLVRRPDYVPIDLSLLVCPGANADVSQLRRAVRRALIGGHAGAPGFFDRARLGFGAEIRLGDVLAAVARAPGIGPVKALTFRRQRAAHAAPVVKTIRLGPTEIAQLAAEERHPERGRLTIRIEGVDPEVPPGDFLVGGPLAETPPGAQFSAPPPPGAQ